jgi:hypothetical protein
MRKIVGVLVVGLMLISSTSMASNDGNDGNALLSKCNALIDSLDTPSNNDTDKIKGLRMGYCIGMMQGTLNFNKLYELMLGKGALFCTPKSGITTIQAVRIVVEYLKKHPDKLHEHESILAYEAFKEAYPCK